MGSKAAVATRMPSLAGCDGCQLRPGCVVHRLLAGSRRRVAAPRRRIVKAGIPLAEEGAKAGAFIVVVSGIAAIRKRNPSGDSVLMELVEAGQTLGYEALAPGGASHASAETVAECEICETAVDEIRNAITSGGAGALELLQQLVQDVERHQEAFMLRVAIPSHQRLQHALLALAEHHGERRDDGSWLVRIPVKRRDLASMVGIRPETFSRIVRSIEESGIAHFFGRQVVIPSLETLRDYRFEDRHEHPAT